MMQVLVMTNRLFMGVSNPEGDSSRHNNMPELVRSTMTYLDEHLTESVSLDELSRTFYHNGTYISRRFKETMGVTIQQYLLWKRIELAKEYLMQGFSLSDTCSLSGFNDYSNFCRSFVKQVGCSPNKYRQQYYVAAG